MVSEVKEEVASGVVTEAASWEAGAEGLPSLGLSRPLSVFFPNLYHSLGISPTAIAILPISPRRALVTAETGSQGCSSVSYS